MDAPGERECSIDFGLNPEGGCSKDNYDRTEVFSKTTTPKFADKLKNTYHLEVQTNSDFNEEKPFEIPDGWKWVRLGDVIEYTENLDIQKKLKGTDLIKYVDIDSIDSELNNLKSIINP